MAPSTLLEKIQRAWQFDSAVGYAMGQKLWQVAAGVVNLILVFAFCTRDEQGFYYTFTSITALQMFAELGFYLVVLNTASHEWSLLRIENSGAISGDPHALSRLASLARLAVRWYAGATAVFILGAGAVGWWLMSRHPHPEIAWQTPWLALILLSGLNFWSYAPLYLLEGCNQIAPVNAFRLRQNIAASLVFWIVLPLAGALWGLVAVATATLAVALHFLFARFRAFFRSLWDHPVSHKIAWSAELWPMQWRLALQGIFTYFVTQAFTPVMFDLRGAAEAGRMGMTRLILTNLQTLSHVWVQNKAPTYGMLIARRQYRELDTLWFRNTRLSLIAHLLGGAAFCLALLALRVFDAPLQAWFHHDIAARLLSPEVTLLMFGGTFLIHATQCESVYLRAHKREVFTFVGVGGGALTGLLLLPLAKAYGAAGVAAASFGVALVFTLPAATLVWWRCRQRWHESS